MAAADFLLQHMSRTLWDPVDPKQLGSLDRKLHARVNGEIYRFARAETRERFRRDPVRWCGIVRDPVTGQTFEPSRRSPRFDVAEGPYFFVSGFDARGVPRRTRAMGDPSHRLDRLRRTIEPPHHT